jgi:hypothetical protein
MELATPHTEEAIKLVDKVGDFEIISIFYETVWNLGISEGGVLITRLENVSQENFNEYFRLGVGGDDNCIGEICGGDIDDRNGVAINWWWLRWQCIGSFGDVDGSG